MIKKHLTFCIVLIFSISLVSCDFIEDKKAKERAENRKRSLRGEDKVKQTWKGEFVKYYKNAGWYCGKCNGESKTTYTKSSDFDIAYTYIDEDEIGFILRAEISFTPRYIESCRGDNMKDKKWDCSVKTFKIEARFNEYGYFEKFLTTDNI